MEFRIKKERKKIIRKQKRNYIYRYRHKFQKQIN